MKEHGYDLQTDVLDDKIRRVVGGGGRPRALVKYFEVSGKLLSQQSNQQTRNSFRRILLLNRLKIYNQGVWAENFRNGWLVDFGKSWTEPHDMLKGQGKFAASATKGRDQVDLVASKCWNKKVLN